MSIEGESEIFDKALWQRQKAEKAERDREKAERERLLKKSRMINAYYITRTILCVTAAACIIAFTGAAVVQKLHDVRYTQTTRNEDNAILVTVFDTWGNKVTRYCQYYDKENERWESYVKEWDLETRGE